MNVLTESYELVNGVLIPKLGFGTWLIDNEKVVDAVTNALKAGYRHIDTAWAYQNEVGVGKAIRESGIPREEIFVTTKVHADFKDYASAKAGIEESLAALDLGYVDLLLIHAPKPWAEFAQGEKPYFSENLDVWKAMEEFYADGRVKAIGVSNFDSEDLANLLDNASVKPAVNQVLAHIGNTPKTVIDFAQENNVLVEAYSPFGHGDILNVPLVTEMAAKYDVTPTQLAVRYLLQLGLLPLPKASSIAHIEANAQVDFKISDDDMATLLAFDGKNYSDANKVFPVYQK